MNLEALVYGNVDFAERTAAKLLAKAKRSGWFKNVIQDAEEFKSEGYAWDVALAKACEYWCS